MNRGEVWRMALDRGESGSGETAFRQVVILTSDTLAVLPLRIIVPLTIWRDEFASAPWMVRVPPVLHSGLESVMAADALQVRSVSTMRLKHKLGDLPEKLVDAISTAVAAVIHG